ncbi:hypothetical protein AYI69_g8940 [Smittium culicis]|uniref:Uncharacterized protein n=1 Tax=Smittium culicis TaxID=133412 RepID=A0A1R1XG70_9FUNG|nr:hypothetical protein AYI69_g8940 [Smittium culicis]
MKKVLFKNQSLTGHKKSYLGFEIWSHKHKTSPLTDAARREFIGLFPKNESMVYEPPPLNEFGLSHEAKKDDSKLFDIQYRLSGLTRPIDYYAHTILQRKPNSLPAESAIEFANAIRILLNAKIPGKAPQILSASSNPLFDPKELVEHVASNKAIQKANVPTRGAKKLDYSVRRSVFQRKFPVRNYIQPQLANLPNSSSLYGQKQLRQEGGPMLGTRIAELLAAALLICDRERVQDPSIDPTKNSDQIEDDSRKKVFKAGYQDNRGENNDPTLKKRDRTGFSRHTRILFDDVYSSKKIRRNSHSFKSETSESASASKALQNGESFDCMQACSPQRLDDKHRSCRRIPSRSFFSIFKEISQFSMGKQNFSLPRSFIWPFLEPTSFHEGIALSSQMGKTAWDKDKCLPRRFVDLRIEQGGIAEEHTESGETPKETGIYNSGKGILIGSLTKPNSSGNENQYTINVVRNTKRQASFIEKAQTMSIALLPGRLMTRRMIELKNEALRINSNWNSESLISWNVRSFLPEIPEVEVFTDASDSGWGIVQGENQYSGAWSKNEKELPINERVDGVFRQQYINSLCEEKRRDPVSCSAQGLRAVVGPLSEFFDSPTAELRPFCNQSSRCSFKDGYIDGMVNIRQDIQEDKYEVRTTRCGYVRSPGEPQTAEICQLEINQNTSRRSATGIFKRKFDNVEKQGLATYSLEDKRTRFLRPCDIERIDYGKTKITSSYVRFVILSPKERRSGSSIEKVCHINSHSIQHLCPVLAYKYYKARIVSEPCWGASSS